MFYAHFVLSKKGPLAKVWLAAHWERKLTKAHVFETNIEETVDGILNPKVKLALRTSGHLLLGVVRIYSRKAKYLLADCNEALVKIKLAFRPVAIDLPVEQQAATKTSITLQVQTCDMVPRDYVMQEIDFDLELEDVSEETLHSRLKANTARPEDITLKEDVIGDKKDEPMDDKLVLDWDEDINNPDELNLDNINLDNLDLDAILPGYRADRLSKERDEPMDDLEKLDSLINGDDGLGNERLGAGFDDMADFASGAGDAAPEIPAEDTPQPLVQDTIISNGSKDLNNNVTLVEPNQGYALAPRDTMQPPKAGLERLRAKRKRKLIVDEQKCISSDQMRQQLQDYSDLVRCLDMAPSTLKLMYLRETSGTDKLWNNPGIMFDGAPGVSHKLCKLFADFAVPSIPEDLDDSDDFFPDDDASVSVLRAHNTTLGNFAPNMDDELYNNIVPDIEAPYENEGVRSPRREKAKRPRIQQEADEESISVEPPEPSIDLPPQSPRKRPIAEEGDSEDGEVEEEAHPEDHDRMSRKTKIVFDQFATLLNRRHAPRHSNPDGSQSVNFKELIRGHQTRKEVAQRFYSTLVLKKLQAVDVEQTEPYGDIWMKKGGRFNEFSK